jgi:phospholipid/cholesterol/gamma-HCH transport system permease protein
MILIDRIGAMVLRPLDSACDMAALFVEAIRTAWTERGPGDRMLLDVILRQILFTGVEALRIVTVVALLLGGAVIIEAFTQLPRVGGESALGSILVVVVVRELGPILTAIIVIGRSGTAISTEIGYMMVNNEMQALVMMGINPMRGVVLPRIIGVSAAIFCLSFYFNIVALFGGYLFARLIIFYPFGRYLQDLGGALGFWDVAVSGIKCLIFGMIVAVVCCQRGFNVRFSFTEIPQATTSAVVTCLYLCFIVNMIITTFFYI